jgi:hypothetical protein
VAAIRHKNANDFVARDQIRNAGAGFDHLACGFMAQDHGHGAGAAAVDNAEIGMAETRGVDADEDFARAGRIEFAKLDTQGLPNFT